MTENLGPWASLRVRSEGKTAADLDELRVAAKHAEEMLSTKGWAFLQNWLAARQADQITLLAAEPTSAESAESFALKRAYAAGFLKGLKHAYATPHAVVEISKQELDWAQRASEELAQRQGEHHG